jgi:hypothetical protein
MTWAAGTMDAPELPRFRCVHGQHDLEHRGTRLGRVGPDRLRLLPCLISLGAFSVGALIAAVVLLRAIRGLDAARQLPARIALELPSAILFRAPFMVFTANTSEFPSAHADRQRGMCARNPECCGPEAEASRRSH